MSEPASGDPTPPAPAPHGPTLRVDRPPTPGRAARVEMAAGELPPFRPDEPTVTISGVQAKARQRTLEFGSPAPVKVTVGPRVKPKKRRRTWPWIAAVILLLVGLGVTLLVMFSRGATIDGNTDLVGLGVGVGVSAVSGAVVLTLPPAG